MITDSDLSNQRFVPSPYKKFLTIGTGSSELNVLSSKHTQKRAESICSICFSFPDFINSFLKVAQILRFSVVRRPKGYSFGALLSFVICLRRPRIIEGSSMFPEKLK